MASYREVMESLDALHTTIVRDKTANTLAKIQDREVTEIDKRIAQAYAEAFAYGYITSMLISDLDESGRGKVMERIKDYS